MPKTFIIIAAFICPMMLANAQAVITSDLSDVNLCSADEQEVVFEITATGFLSFVWEILRPSESEWEVLTDESPQVVGGATTNAMTYLVSGDMTGTKIRCVVLGAGPAAVSHESLITVSIHIIQHPVVRAICLEGNAEYTVEASGEALSYQWQKSIRDEHFDIVGYGNLTNGGYYSGVTTATLTVTEVDSDIDPVYAIYRCVMTALDACEAISNTAPLYLYETINITEQPASASCLSTGDNVTLMVAINIDLPGLYYKWQSKSDGSFVDIEDNEFYSGSSTREISISGMTQDHFVSYRCVIGDCSAPEISDEVYLFGKTYPASPVFEDLKGECTMAIPDGVTLFSECAGGELVGVPDHTDPVTKQGTTTITWTYTDSDNDVFTVSRNIVLDDVTSPVPDQSTLADVSSDNSITSLDAPTATDNCAASVIVTNDVSFPITADGTTVVTWTYDDGHGNTSSQKQNVVITRVLGLGAEEKIMTGGIPYPNPVIDRFQLMGAKLDLRVDLYMVNGRLVKHFESVQNHYDISELPNGIYILTMTDNTGVYRSKILKK